MDKGLLNFIANEKNLAEDFKDNYKADELIFVYGNGASAYWYIKYLNSINVKVTNIVDRDPAKQNLNYMGIDVISLKEMINKIDGENYKVVIASPKYREEIMMELQKHMSAEKIYSFEVEIYYNYLTDINAYREYLINNFEFLNEFYEKLEDQLSKDTLVAIIKGRISANQQYFYEVMAEEQYYPPGVIELNENETIVEMGAYDGETLKDIILRTRGLFKKIICFEPDKKYTAILNEIIANTDGNVQLISKGTWHESGRLTFQCDMQRGTSKIGDYGNEDEDFSAYSIDVVAIDDIVDEEVTFIKMDIEGAELNALKGCANIIKKYRPKLAVCIYHKNEDLIEIPRYLMELVPEYKFYIRHHNYAAMETILYAVL